jgi:hypothetical protein
MSRSHPSTKWILASWGLFLVVLVFAVGSSLVRATHVDYQTCTVESKDRAADRGGRSDARVYTEDCGVFQVKDSLFEGTWRSADTYASIEEGHRYNFKTRGYRFGLLSWFPNIVQAQEVK